MSGLIVTGGGMWIEVIHRFKERLHPRQIRVLKPGNKCSIRRHIGEKAIAEGKAVEIETPTREEAIAWRRGS